MNWRVAGSNKNEDGTRNVTYRREGLLAVVTFDDPHVELIDPSWKVYARCKDFVGLERWLTAQAAGETNLVEANQTPVSQCLGALKNIKRDVANLSDFVPFQYVEENVNRLIVGENDKTNASINEDKILPRTLVCLLITNVLDQELSSGRHHIYRGVLSDSGAGLLTLWDWATDELDNDNYFSTPESAAIEKGYIREKIKKVG